MQQKDVQKDLPDSRGILVFREAVGLRGEAVKGNKQMRRGIMKA